MEAYDEFAMLADNAAEAGIGWKGPPTVRRVEVRAPSGQAISALVWGEEPPELVLVHGGAQNAHTWDTVALALGRPLVALDLPGHGHSAWRADHDYRPATTAPDVVAAIEALAPDALGVVGMSLGGLTALAVARLRPELVPRLALVDVTPGVTRDKAAAVVAFVGGPRTFPSFDAILERTVAHNPTRSLSSLRRGVLHNAVERADGTWAWRYDPVRPGDDHGGGIEAFAAQLAPLWETVSTLRCPVLLVRGSLSPVVDDADVVELRRRQPQAQVVTVEGAGHSVQGDRPVELAALLDGFLADPGGRPETRGDSAPTRDPYQAFGDELAAIVRHASEQMEAAVRRAHQEAAAIVADAEAEAGGATEKANAIVASAREQADEVLRVAEVEAAKVLSEARSRRDELQEVERELRRRLEGVEKVFRSLETTASLERTPISRPAPPAAAPRPPASAPGPPV